MARPERRRKNGSNNNNSNAFLPTTRQQQQQRSEEDDAVGMHHVPLNDSAAVTVKSSGEADNRYSEEDSDDWGSSTGGRRGRNHLRAGEEGRENSNDSASGLHHRHVVRRSASGDQADEYERGMAGGGIGNNNNINSSHSRNTASNSHNFHSRFQAQRRRRRYPCARWLRTCVLAGIPAYLVLIFFFLKRMNHHHDMLNSKYSSNNLFEYGDPETVAAVRALHAAADTARRLRQQRDEQEWDEAAAAAQQTNELFVKRRDRTRPPAGNLNLVIPPPTLLSADQLERPDTLFRYDDEPLPQSLLRHSKLEEICGFQAQNAALTNPEAYIYRDSLVMPKSRATRVLLTGILTQPAYLLALALKERCGVQVVIAIDAMYPNSIRNRLRLQEQMSVLSKFVPKLVRPIFLAFAGIDPLKHAKNVRELDDDRWHTGGEMDVVQMFKPTHIVHMASYDPAVYRYDADPDWKNTQSPYVRTRGTEGSTTVVEEEGDEGGGVPYDPALYALRMGMLSMEQILAAIAAAPAIDRPHFIYASSTGSAASSGQQQQQQQHSGDKTMHIWARRMDEVIADYYYQQYGVYSVGMRLPDTVYGPWGHPEQDLYKILDLAAAEASFTNTTVDAAKLDAVIASSDTDKLDLLHVEDVVDGLIAAMQYRPPSGKPEIFEFSSGTAITLQQVQEAAKQILDRGSTAFHIPTRDSTSAGRAAAQEKLQQALGWSQRVPIEDGLVRALAWHLHRLHPYGPPLRSHDGPEFETGDELLKRHSLPTVAPDEILGHAGRPFLPCASECSVRDQCVPTVFDELLPMTQELTEECDIVLYTQDFDKDAEDLVLQSEFLEDGDPLVCNFAFVASESKLVDTVISKVPNSELGKLGFELTKEDANRPGGIKKAKYEKLNGRLLYRGWILIWTMNTPDELPVHEKFFLKLSPGRLFHEDVKSAVFIDQGFGVSPKADDIKFLVHEMQRKPWSSRVVKRKTRPKAKFLLPAEPQRRAVILMSELKFQDSSNAERLSPDEKISTYEATRFMRFANGEEPLGKEPADIKLQREFYDRLRAQINPDTSRAEVEPLHKFELKHWDRSRWVAHDLVQEEGRQLRCEWYQEHVHWGTDLDPLSFAFVMERLELDRKLAHHEPDEIVQKHLSEKTEMKKLLSDTFEWHALKTEPNRLYSPYEEMQILPYDMDYTDERALDNNPLHEIFREDGADVPLYVRIISDRIMSYARKAWNQLKPSAEMFDEHKSEL